LTVRVSDRTVQALIITSSLSGSREREEPVEAFGGRPYR
jgi:hypothetical protein